MAGRGHRKRKPIYRGRVVYMARAFYQGKKRERICATETECRRVERALFEQLKAEIDAGRAETEAAPLRTLIAVLDERVLALDANPRKSSTSADRSRSFASMLAKHYAGLALRPIATITSDDIVAYRDARLKLGRAPGTVNRELHELRASVKWARPDFKLSTEIFLPEDDLHADSLNPDEAALMRREGTRGQPGKRGHGWDPAEGLYWPFSAIERVLLVTGLRVTEVATLRREAVRLDLGEIRVRVKGGRIERLAIGEEVQEILRDALERQTTPFVFPNEVTGQPYTSVSISRAHRRRVEAALGRRFRLHDTRHHAGTTAMRAGATLPELQQYLRLKSPKLVQRYARFEKRGMRDLSNAVAALTSGATPAGIESLLAAQTSPPAEAAPPSRDRVPSRARR